MTRAPWIPVALLLSAPAFAADPSEPAEPKMHASFIGEGGGYKHPDPATDQYMQGTLGAPPASDLPPAPRTSPEPAAKSDDAPSTTPAAKPASFPAPSPVSPRTGAPSRSFSGRPPAAERNAPVPGETRPAGRSSLWNGLVQPLDMKGSDAASADPARARDGSDRDYETHILGMKDAPARPMLGAEQPAASAPLTAAAGPARGEGGKVFVSLEIDPKEAGSLRDAVAGLGASTGFAADARFEAMAGPGGSALISGWIPAAHLGDALTRPGVKRLRVETRARPSAPRETSGEFVVGLRVDEPARARESVDAGVSALTSAAGFRLTRVIGLEKAPDGRSVAVVAGTLPLSRLEKAMSLSEVATILPAGGEPPAPSASAAASAPASSLSGFLRFAAERGPWLIILTLLLALPSLRDPARRAAAVFNPYR